MAGWRRRLAGVALVAGLASGGLWAGWRMVDAVLGPPDLAATREGSALVTDRSGQLLRPFTTADGRWKLPLSVEEVDPGYLALLKAYEDQRYDRHGGIDFLAMGRAVGQMIRHGRIVSGGSTLTMQVARLIEPREERTFTAKFRQMARAWQLEIRYSKREILDFYLTLAPYGGNIEGVRAASLAYFGKEPKRLALPEAALLVALPQSPEARRPDRYPVAARRARDRVLDLAAARGAISRADAALAKADPVPTARRAFPVIAPHAAEAALRAAPAGRVHRLSLDFRMQTALEQLVRERVEAFGPRASIAIFVMEHASGEVRASVSGPDLFNTLRSGAVDLTQAVRSPGSALKPMIYAMAFDNGLAHPETMVEDRPSRFASYSPENFDLTYQGNVTARVALQQSLNVPAVDLLSEVGPFRFLARLRAAGADVVLPKEAPPGLAAALGGLGIRMQDLAMLYAGLARGGATVPLVWRPATGAAMVDRRLTGPVPAWYVADILRGTPPPPFALAGRIAFKTGTSYGYRDAWAAGFDRRHTIVVWVGRPDGAPMPGMTGRFAAAPILFDAFQRIGTDAAAPPAPRDALLVTNAQLPPPLRSLHKDAKGMAMAAPTHKIAFPP
ncbi:MAG: penicillin-binding protein 1C, partial [Proteobacteria bacterium]|nr:penicillin-binding protein 1C [Pseudomonadota bacterium]